MSKNSTKVSLTESEKMSYQGKLSNYIETLMVSEQVMKSHYHNERGVCKRTFGSMVSKKVPHEPLISSIEKLLYLFHPLDIGQIGNLLTNKKSSLSKDLTKEESDLLSISKQIKISAVKKFIKDHKDAAVSQEVKERLRLKFEIINMFSALDTQMLKTVLSFIRQIQQ